MISDATMQKAMENSLSFGDVNILPATYASNVEVLHQEKIHYEITRDPVLLRQYYDLRTKSYRRDLGLKTFCGSEDEYDRISHIIIARIRDKVIGGLRVTVSTPMLPLFLPMEEGSFIIKNLFPHLELSSTRYFETSRLVIEEGYRNQTTSLELNAKVLKLACDNNCKYQFSITTLNNFRALRIISTRLGLRSEILKDIAVPVKVMYKDLDDQGKRLYLCVTYI